jgi:polyhydroxyalkanoate synthesis regulator phasin
MNFQSKYLDELVENRKEAREQRNWKLSDEIRDYLDTKHIFIIDEKEGQVVYHRIKGTRRDLIDQLKKEKRSVKLFDSWLFSMKANIV